VLGVVPCSAFSTRIHTKARCAGCGTVSVVRPRAVARIVLTHLPHASPRQSIGAAAQPAHAADRFAREIVRILTVLAARLRRLMGKPLGGYSAFDRKV
jgi:NAD(P)H-hydrate repair Nnr-like enzyme with NAD(P)H-hydrate dehydratase domain